MRPSRTSRRRRWTAAAVLLAALSLLTLDRAAMAARNDPAGRSGDERSARFATFNASLNRAAEGELVADLSTPDDVQAQAVAEVIQRVRPDVLLINEFDFDAEGLAARLFQRNYLSVGHNGAAPIHYPFRFVAPSNTGIPSGFDLDNNGTVGGGNDAFGFGDFPGQFGMAVFSRFPILRHRVRTFQLFLWKDMPGALLPDDPATPAPAGLFRPSGTQFEVRLADDATASLAWLETWMGEEGVTASRTRTACPRRQCAACASAHCRCDAPRQPRNVRQSLQHSRGRPGSPCGDRPRRSGGELRQRL